MILKEVLKELELLQKDYKLKAHDAFYKENSEIGNIYKIKIDTIQECINLFVDMHNMMKK